MKSPVNKFFLKILLFSVPVVLFFEVLFRLGFTPIVTNSTLFDLKMQQVQHIKHVKVMAIGSSLGLYELNSHIITQNIKGSYYNFSSWGLQMVDMKPLLEAFVDEHHPKYVIVCSSFTDFAGMANSTYLNYINSPRIIKNHLPELLYLTSYHSLQQIIRRKNTAYPLKLDANGGATLHIKQNEMNRKKWDEHNIFPTRYSQANYNALDSISASLKAKNIKLIFIQAPIKSSYANTAAARQVLQSHFDKCRSSVESRGGTYLNYYNPAIFTDGLFFDQYHLQDTGSFVLTKEIVEDLGKIVQ